jgi:NAD(P)H dehydrogenase (quinone)
LEEGNSFSPIVASNRQTEMDVRNSGLQWAIGRNGIYIEPDLEYIENYLRDGAIVNCAADGKCGYTSRTELAHAYSMLLTDNSLNGETYNLFGETITQEQLCLAINKSFQVDLKFTNISVHDYLALRKAALGDFLGTIISGIYEGIKDGAFNVASDFLRVSKRAHKSIDEMIQEFKNQTKSI